jgi:predicted MFS family arabinose efflux permease
MAEMAGWFWVILTVAGVAMLALAMIYGTTRWRERRKMREPGSVERQPGPAPKDAVPSDDDRRAA